MLPVESEKPLARVLCGGDARATVAGRPPGGWRPSREADARRGAGAVHVGRGLCGLRGGLARTDRARLRRRPHDSRARSDGRAGAGDSGDSGRDDDRRRPRGVGTRAMRAAASRRRAALGAVSWGALGLATFGCGPQREEAPKVSPPSGRTRRRASGRAWSRPRSRRAACAIRACSRRCARCRATCSSDPSARAQAYEDHPLPIGEQPDDLAALHRRPDDRAARASAARRASSRSGPGPATRAPCSREIAAEVYSIEIVPDARPGRGARS